MKMKINEFILQFSQKIKIKFCYSGDYISVNTQNMSGMFIVL